MPEPTSPRDGDDAGRSVIHDLDLEIAPGEMIGLVSIGDAVSARLKELHAEKEALTGMIMGN